MTKTKDIVVGLGEIGSPILKIISKGFTAVGLDLDPKLMSKSKFEKFKKIDTDLLHICIPFNKKFVSSVIALKKSHNPKGVVIHSTISPYTTEKLQKKLDVPIIYSATRGVHKRMFQDLKKYAKFFSVYDWAPNSKWAINTFEKRMKSAGVKTKKISTPITLELAKIVVDTSYYGWLINYAQISNMISVQHKVDYDEMWSFSDEIHQNLGNRPKMFPGFIGGHCVIPNLELIHNRTLDLIDEINKKYLKNVKNAKSISKKYVKGKQSYNI